MAIFGVHSLLYSREPEKLRALLRDVFQFPCVDAHGGWLIFKLPPGELGVHPGEGPFYESGRRHELSFMCDDLDATMKQLARKGVVFKGVPQDQNYGRVVTMALPGEVEVALYQPRHKMALKLRRAPPAAGRKPASKRPSAPRRRGGPRAR